MSERNEPVGIRPDKKKPYVKPVVESEQVFETLALACAKCQRGPRAQGQCRAFLRTS